MINLWWVLLGGIAGSVLVALGAAPATSALERAWARIVALIAND